MELRMIVRVHYWYSLQTFFLFVVIDFVPIVLFILRHCYPHHIILFHCIASHSACFLVRFDLFLFLGVFSSTLRKDGCVLVVIVVVAALFLFALVSLGGLFLLSLFGRESFGQSGLFLLHLEGVVRLLFRGLVVVALELRRQVVDVGLVHVFYFPH